MPAGPPVPVSRRLRAVLAPGLAVIVLLGGCGTRVEFRDPTIAEVAVGAAKGALESTLLGSPVPVGAVTGAAGTLIEVRGPVYSQFPGRPSYRGSCRELRDCVFSGP